MALLGEALGRIRSHGIWVTAGYLSYLTCLSIVPLLTVAVTILSAFSGFEKVDRQVESFVLRHLLPASGEVIHRYVREFVDNATHITSIGTLVLVVTALLLMQAVDVALNEIWGIRERRRPLAAFSLYWTCLTLGPLLLGVGVVESPSLAGLGDGVDHGEWSWAQSLAEIFPFLTTFLAFFALYQTVPLRRIRFWHAAVGGAVAALLFEIAKALFTAYLTHFASYQAIYGALAGVPIFLVWLYISWGVILTGAEIAATLTRRADPAAA